MAIVQISRITARKGLTEDLPQPLAGAELGWATDERRLFIGNGELADGAPVVGNTEVLTEFSDILSFAGQYIYQGQAAGYTVQTGATTGSPVSQSIQRRLDSYAVVTDFGATGDGQTDDTAAINRALFQLYCVQNNTQIRRSLFFPAGRYIITDTILVPAFAKLYGEGGASSIIDFNVQNWAANTAYVAGVLVYDVANAVYRRSLIPVPATGILTTNATYWVTESLPSYVVQTADSLQQTGVNIATNGATPPENIQISEIGIVSNQVLNGILIEAASNCDFDSVNITGPLTTTELVAAGDDTAAVRWASTVSLVCEHVNWNNCVFSGFTFGTKTDQQIKGVVFANCVFDTLYQGVVLGDTVVVLGGATGFKLMHCMFDNIYVEGFICNNVSLNASAYNIFYDVGNHFNGAALPASSIILINADNNVSIGDMFQRNTAQSVVYPRIKLFNSTTSTVPASIGVDSAVRSQLGSYVRNTGVQATLGQSASNATLFTISSVYIKAFKMDYTITRDTSVRTGTLTVVNDADDSAGDGLSYTDDFVQNSDPDITLAVTDVSTTMTVTYSSDSVRPAGLIYYSVTYLGLSS